MNSPHHSLTRHKGHEFTPGQRIVVTTGEHAGKHGYYYEWGSSHNTHMVILRGEKEPRRFKTSEIM